ncbi:MAG: phosphate--acyl-ACP acyltransferase [Acutalibacteraceae bacterium]
MKIIVDAFGGDNAPLEIIKGSKMAQDEFGYDILLVGSKEIIKKTAESNRIDISRMQIIDANDIISMKDEPISITKSKNRSSMAIGLKLLKEGAGDAFVSAGNSGALAVGATLTVKRIKGIKRCAFAPVIPKDKGWFMLIDSGANVECRPEMLEQFGIMGSVYMENVMHVQKPKVGLVNVGIEPTKGSDMYKHAYDLMRKNRLQSTRKSLKSVVSLPNCDAMTLCTTPRFSTTLLGVPAEGMKYFSLLRLRT